MVVTVAIEYERIKGSIIKFTSGFQYYYKGEIKWKITLILI